MDERVKKKQEGERKEKEKNYEGKGEMREKCKPGTGNEEEGKSEEITEERVK